ncbi:cytosine permease [Streptomyces sp. NPDC057253]|uniref:cytosine permease n=1 Tax=Streptomyces sp. NPDC057253 TaxID=3346069 RepID=UPI003628E468
MPMEQRGVDTVPEEERTSGPRDLVSILLGSNLCLGVIVFGWLPPSFGLGWWASVSAIVAGTLLGTALTAPLALISLRTATNLSTSSGAQFGVRGRLVGSVVGLLLALGYTALTVWIGGDVMVGTLGRLTGLPASGWSYGVVYGLLAAATVAGAVYGYRVLLAMSRVLAVGMTALLVLGVLAYAPHFTTAALPEAGGYLLGGFWPTWLLALVAAGLSGPVAFITLLGDYTRYISPARHTSRRVLHATWLGLVAGLLVPQLFGTFTAYAARAAADYAGPLVSASPAWYLVPLLLAASAGSVGNAGLMLYSMGLDLDAILPRASRATATYTVAVVATACVFVGHYRSSAQDAMTSFVLLLTAIGTPWAVVTLIGFARCRGVYDPEALQVFNRRSRGGIYWYRGGWNLPATVSWALGAGVGLLAVSLPSYEGPLLSLTGGVDCSFLLSGLVGGAVYLLLSRGEHPRAAAEPVAAAARTKR